MIDYEKCWKELTEALKLALRDANNNFYLIDGMEERKETVLNILNVMRQ